GGLYQQPPFYRELRDLQGQLHLNIPAQKSIHLLTGSDWQFKAWGRPFKFTTEIYYKFLNDLIPYEIDNVRIRYLSDQTAKGFAEGIDFKINGDFVEGLESWASLSIMKTMEDIKGDFYYKRFNSDGQLIIPGYTTNNIAVDSMRIEPGYIPRPTDQRINFSLFFQDYLPNNPTYKVHLSLFYGSSLPFGPPESPQYLHTLRIPPYRRVDIGFSKQIIGEGAKYRPKGRLNYIKSLWVSAEIFNLFQISNTVSYIWISDVNNRQYAIPNYLTPRLINIKMIAKF
ncbi:MAG: TonB-dependent receptor, partial [Bacteroidota bacterium]|nr:TonB-dependent receptor [Bacteroidota bacterium]